MTPFASAFCEEILTKTAVSSDLVRGVVRRGLASNPDRVGQFIGHLRELGGARPTAAKDVAVQEARNFMGWGARKGHPNRSVSGTIVDGVRVN